MLTYFLKRSFVVAGGALAAVVASAGIASGAPPDGPAFGDQGQFLCPAVGAGTLTADAQNGEHGVGDVGTIASGQQTFLPGNNQAGANADANALNPDNADTTEGPGDGNSGWSPIWPGDA